MTLTDKDIQRIAEAVRPHNDCVFKDAFDDDDKHVLKNIIGLYNDSTSAMRKGVIGLVLLGALALAVVGSLMTFK
jgi:hypothetical protein